MFFVPNSYQRCFDEIDSATAASLRAIRAILFDKDGTLVDVDCTWGPATLALLMKIANDDQEVIKKLAIRLDFSVPERKINPTSLLFRTEPKDYGRLISGILDQPYSPAFGTLVDQIYLEEGQKNLTFTAAVEAIFKKLKLLDFLIGISTNDLYLSAYNQLKGVQRYLDFVAGADSGWGTKPKPGHVIAFAEQHDLRTSEILVVGDSRDDIQAALNAGSPAVAVMTGPRLLDDMDFFRANAVAIFQDISSLPDWLLTLRSQQPIS
jgi:phosphoglycolate phosphatase